MERAERQHLPVRLREPPLVKEAGHALPVLHDVSLDIEHRPHQHRAGLLVLAASIDKTAYHNGLA
jgi:hypothetical protein